MLFFELGLYGRFGRSSMFVNAHKYVCTETCAYTPMLPSPSNTQIHTYTHTNRNTRAHTRATEVLQETYTSTQST